MTSKQQEEFLLGQLLDKFAESNRIPGKYILNVKQRAWEELRYLPKGEEGRSILDVGGMNGMLAEAYMEIWNYSLVGMLDMAIKQDSVEYEASDGRICRIEKRSCNIELETWPFETESFDAVASMAVFEHLIFDPMFAMSELSRVTKPGGHLLMTVPNVVSNECLKLLLNQQQPGYMRSYLACALESGKRDVETIYNLGHFHEYTQQEIKSLAEAAGFDVIRLDGYSCRPSHYASWKYSFMNLMLRMLFPRSKRITETNLRLCAIKKKYTPLDKVKTRYPEPLYRATYL